MLMHEDSPGDTAPESGRSVPPGRSEPTSEKKLRAGDLRDYQLWAASSPVRCRHDRGLLARQVIFRAGDRVLRS
jgi:hypothetical protein